MKDIFDAKKYWDERLQHSWGLEGVGFLGLGTYYNHFLYKVQKMVFNHHVKKLNLKYEEIKVLDVGSGTGFYVNLWKLLGTKSLVGFDISTVAIERLKSQYPEFLFFQQDIGDTIQGHFRQNGAFDVVTAFAVLYHIVDDECYVRALENIASLIKPGGYFIFTENFIHGGCLKSRHQASRSLEDIQNILEKTGLQPVTRAPKFVLMNAPVDTKSVLAKLYWELLSVAIQANELIGGLIGMVLFPLELVLVRLLKGSWTTEIMICRKA